MGHILGPFFQRPLKHLHTSGLGAPKKKRQVASDPSLVSTEGLSINNFISKEDSAIHYSTIDDAVALHSRFGKGAMIARVGLKSAFKMVPIQASEWELLGMYWQGQNYAFPLVFARLLASSTTLPARFTGSWRKTMEQPYSITWMTSSWLALQNSTSARRLCQPCSGSAKEWEFQSPQRSVRSINLHHFPGHCSRLLTAAAQIATREAAGHFIPDQVMAWRMQSHQEGALISDQEASICSRDGSSRTPVLKMPHSTLNHAP